jgi:hypothetical protein
MFARQKPPRSEGNGCLDSIALLRRCAPMNVSPCHDGFCQRVSVLAALLTGSGFLSIRENADRPLIMVQHGHANRCRDATQRRSRMGTIFPIPWYYLARAGRVRYRPFPGRQPSQSANEPLQFILRPGDDLRDRLAFFQARKHLVVNRSVIDLHSHTRRRLGCGQARPLPVP